jgi:oligopeptide/dipeptide ABC transporter ATP-binding protein
LTSIPGHPPDFVNMPTGCKFHPRCAFATDLCQQVEPKLEDQAGHLTACHNWEAVLASQKKGE